MSENPELGLKIIVGPGYYSTTLHDVCSLLNSQLNMKQTTDFQNFCKYSVLVQKPFLKREESDCRQMVMFRWCRFVHLAILVQRLRDSCDGRSCSIVQVRIFLHVSHTYRDRSVQSV